VGQAEIAARGEEIKKLKGAVSFHFFLPCFHVIFSSVQDINDTDPIIADPIIGPQWVFSYALILTRHSCASRNPCSRREIMKDWIPACAGMTG
jgi:hypothetical protein